MHRTNQVILIGSLIPFCWLAMMATHEFGHVLGALVSKGSVTKVVIHPLSISRTDVSPNPSPLFVVWLGPIIGVVLPLAAFGVCAYWKLTCSFLVRFFAGFCLIANGSYIGAGSFNRVGDAGTMIENGAPIWTLWLFGSLAFMLGFVLWNGLGKHFGLGESNGNVDERMAYLSLGLFIASWMLAVLLSPRF